MECVVCRAQHFRLGVGRKFPREEPARGVQKVKIEVWPSSTSSAVYQTPAVQWNKATLFLEEGKGKMSISLTPFPASPSLATQVKWEEWKKAKESLSPSLAS